MSTFMVTKQPASRLSSAVELRRNWCKTRQKRRSICVILKRFDWRMPSKILLQLLFSTIITVTLSIKCTWQECNQNEKCIFELTNESISIKNGNVVELNCNRRIPNKDLYMCLDTTNNLTHYDSLTLQKCIFYNFHMDDFLQSTQPSTIIIRDTAKSARPLQLFVSDLSFIKAIRISGVRTSGIFNLTLRSLRDLSTFQLKDSRFSEFANATFENLPAITSLEISKSTFKNLPEDIFQGLHSLERLYLTYNGLTTIGPATFENLYRLTYLDLKDNKIRELDANIFKNLSNLLTLCVEGNQLSRFPMGIFSHLPKLESLNISQNRGIARFSERFFKEAFSLKKLDASECSLVALQATLFTYTTRLEVKNVMADSSMAVIKLNKRNHQLKNNSLKMRKQFFPSILAMVPNTKALRSTNTMKNLQELYLRYNNLIKIEEHTFDPLINLKVIDVSHNPLRRLPPVHPFGPSLRLERIVLSGCRLFRFSNEQIFPPSLKLLSLDNNDFVSLPPSLLDSMKLSPSMKLRLSGNRWRCSCERRDFFDWVNEHKEAIEDYNSIWCFVGWSFQKFLFSENTSLETRCRTMAEENSTIKAYTIVTFLIMMFIPVLLIACSMLVFEQRILIGSCLHECTVRWFSPREVPFHKQKRYHAFIAYDVADSQTVNEILTKLEPDKKLCLRGRERFPVKGKIQSIIYAMVHSNVTLLFISKEFIQSSWFEVDFRSARYRVSQTRKIKFYSIFLEDVDVNLTFPDVRELLKGSSLKLKERYFWKKLSYILRGSVRN